jgi:hypothetical protein
MSEEFHLRFANDRDAATAADRLSAIRIDGRPAMQVERRDASVFSGCIIYSQLAHDAILEGGENGSSTPFFRLFYQVESLKSGMHHPDGILWMRIPGSRPGVSRQKVSLRDLAPTILSLFGIPKPAYMTGKVLPVVAPAWRT